MVRVLISSPLDVTDERNCVGVADTVRNEYGPLDILINNAGIGHVGTIEATAGADLDRLYAVNVRGVFNVTKAFMAIHDAWFHDSWD
jgi:NAD(P)-dependent dehydrogenase (short-subunit alcohol dehydrogenase family)